MQIFVETPRLILREMVPADAPALFELDSDPAVHRYLGRKPLTQPEQAVGIIEMVRRQYVENGIGRWAVIEKATGNFTGWCGFKLIREPINGMVDFHDIGYRFMQRYWGRGYATESARACVPYGFNELNLKEIHAFADADNKGSRNVLEKIGLSFVELFDYDGAPHAWYRIYNH